MKPRLIAAVSIASLLLAAPALSQSPLPRPGQLPPAGGQGAPPPQRGPAAPPQQPAAAPAKPYKPVSITAPAAVADPSFEAFRKQLGAVAEKKDRKALAGLVAQNFFWMGEKGEDAVEGPPHKRLAPVLRQRVHGAGLGDARCRVHRPDRHAVSGSQGHDLRAGRADLQSAGA